MKYIKTNILLLIFLALPFCLSAQQPLFRGEEGEVVIARLGGLLPDTVTLVGSLQGMAIHRRQAYLLRDKGQCVVIDLKRKRFVTAFQLPDNHSHCNNASFGKGRKPLLYVSECFGEKRCLVTDVFSPERRLVQTIRYRTPHFAQDWCLDAEHGYLYAYSGVRGGPMQLNKFSLPPAGSDSVELHDTELLERCPVSCVKVAQGSKIHRGCAFLPDGDEAGNYFLHVIDLKKQTELCRLDLNRIGCEPEGVDIKGRWLYVSFHTPDPADNMIYRFRIRPSFFRRNGH